MFDEYDGGYFHYSTESEWDQADAYQRGEENPEAAWVLTDRDNWYPNPFYRGPAMPHPELEIEDVEAWRREQERFDSEHHSNTMRMQEDYDDDIPF